MRTHPDRVAAALDGVPPRLRPALLRCARGELPPNVALTHLFMAARDARAAQSALADASQALRQSDPAAAGRLHQAIDLWEHTPSAFATVNAIAHAVDHKGHPGDCKQALAHLAGAFDRALALSPAASVALYSLGRADLLDGASGEIVERMRTWRLLGPDCAALEIGCGNGRILQRLASEVRLVLAIDISVRMLDAARRLCDGQTNVVCIRSSGIDLSTFADAQLDLIYAIDSFPYLVQCGLAAGHLDEAARVLRPGGRLLIVNYSYRDDLAADRGEIVRVARDLGLAIERNGTQDFAFWDGCVFLLRKEENGRG